MSPASDNTGSAILDALGTGLPMLLLQFVLVLALLVAGIFIYMAITPFHERELLRNGNPAAATVLGGALVALAVPLAALLATTGALLDIFVWGVVAVLLQLLTVAIVSHLFRGMRVMIEAGQVAGAIPLVAAQLSIGLLNAAAMVPA
jgi:putative membrane protein